MKSFLHVYDVLRTLAPRAQSYLGVGVQEGGCVSSVVRSNPDISLILCDTWGPHHGGTDRRNHNHIVELLARERHRGAVKFLDGDSHILVPRLCEKVDLSYVDGDHSEEGALQDFRNVWAMTRWAMVAHDVNTLSVTVALSRFITEIRDGTMTYHIAEGPGQGTIVLYRDGGGD
jgi:hypothetical protein